jgi:hypothetical protein
MCTLAHIRLPTLDEGSWVELVGSAVRAARCCAGVWWPRPPPGALAIGAAPAWAHVSVSGDGATQGGFAVIAFRVPTESDTASTVGLEVQLPADQPLAFASVQPKPGWTYTVQTKKLATTTTTPIPGPTVSAVSAAEPTDAASKGSVAGAYLLGGLGLLAGLAALGLVLSHRRPTGT